MPGHRIAGFTIAGDWPLPELPQADGCGADWVVEVDSHRPAGRWGAIVHQAIDPDGRSWCVIRRGRPGQYLIRFPSLADFVVRLSERRIVCHPGDRRDEPIARHLLLDQVIPRVAAMDGAVVLHASAVTLDGRAVAFVGPTGAGKSTVAASFITSGARLLADDFVRVDEAASGFVAVPSYPGLRLWPDSAKEFAGRGDSLEAVVPGGEKQRLVVRAQQAASEPCPLAAIVILDESVGDAEVDVRRLLGPGGFMAVYSQTFHLDRSGRERQREEFDRVASLTESTAILRLEYPRGYRHLAEVQGRVLSAIPAR